MNTSLYGGIIEISPDGQPVSPNVVLAYRSGEKQGVIQNVDSFRQLNHLMNASEISFDVHKGKGDVACALWDEIKDFKLVFVPHLGTSRFNPWYEISVTTDESDDTVKHCQGVHAQESELGQLILNEIEINTETDIARDDYSPTVLFDPTNEDSSLLHRLLKDKATHYSIYHVDSSLAKMQRTFTWDGVSITDAFSDIGTELECLFVYGESTEDDGKIHRTISVYDLNDNCLDCGERGSFNSGVCPKCGSTNIKTGYGEDSGIFLNHDNFAESITYSSNKDQVKNCFRLVAGDDLMTATIRNINPSGTNYIWYLSDSMRADMSETLRARLETYDKEYQSYENNKTINIPESVVSRYNNLVNKYKLYDSTLVTCSYPITGYAALTDLYYNALNFYSLLKTTLAPASEIGKKTTAKDEIKKLTVDNLSPLGVDNASTISAATVNSLLTTYAKVYVDTSLYKISIAESAYANKVWRGKFSITSYTDDTDTATTSELTIIVSDAEADYLRTQIDKAIKRNDVDASSTVALFDKEDSEFIRYLSFYSIDNLNILANICRGCLDVMIQSGTANPDSELYSSMYLPYYNKSQLIQSELRERESETLLLRGTKSEPTGILDYVEAQRQAIANTLDLRKFLGESLWVEFCSFRRDDTYKNDNFISDGLSDTELIAQAQEFVKNAQREIIKSATLQHSISCNLNNFLLVKEQDVIASPTPIVTVDGVQIISHDILFLVKGDAVFSPLLVKFEVGNWLHIEIDNVIYKLRMTDYEIDYDNLETLNVDFSDVTYGMDSVSDVRSILAQAQSMATSYSSTQRQANKGNVANQQIVNMVENGLDLTNKKIINSADNQTLLVDETGLLMRERNDFDDDYNAEQVKIINHGFYYTNDNWRTVQTGLGKFIYFDPETGTYKEDYGLIAHKIVGNIILGNDLGIYNESGSMKFDQNGMTITADATDNNKDLITIQRKNEDGSYTKYVYMDDDGNIKINGRSIQMTVSEDLPSYIANQIKQEATALVVQLTNEYTGVSTDSDGNGGSYSACYTSVLVFSGSTDITDSADVSWTVTASTGVIGTWDSTNHVYTVTNLTANVGEVTFDIAYNGITASKKFRVAKIRDGEKGDKGEQGIPGDSEYIHIKYSAVENPTDAMMSETPSTYIGICVDKNVSDPTTASSYSWSRFIGKDGDQGLPGKQGDDGLTSYVHFAYAQSADGSVNFKTTEYDGATYIGVLTDFTLADSTNYKDYAWSLIKGDKGDTGVGVQSIVEYYAVNNDASTTPIDSVFDTTVPPMSESNRYLWNYELVTYTNGNTDRTSKHIIGVYGETGKPGVSITGVENYYLATSASSGVTTETAGWTTAVQSVSAALKYLWNYEVVTYSDATTSATTPCIIGAYGDKGDSVSILTTEVVYIPSDDGINPPNAYSLADSSGKTIVDGNGNELASNIWLSYIPHVIDGAYLWTRTTVNYSDGNSTITYSVSRQGIDGTNGTDGIDGRDGRDGSSNYVHIKYSAFANPTDDQITEVPSDYIGVCVNSSIADPITANSYTWSKFRGKDGDNGLPGADGWVHFAYATSSDGSKNFSTSEFTGATYIGVYSDHKEADSTNYKDYAWSLIKGDKGDKGDQGIPGATGVGISSITEYYAINNSSSSVPADSDFDTSVKTPTASKRYLWNYETVTYTDSSTQRTDKHVIGIYGDTGDNGRSITGVTNYYLATSASSGVTKNTAGWTPAVQSVSAEKKYLWNYEVVSYSYGDPTETPPCIIGTFGENGKTSYIHIKYSAVENPTNSDLTETPDKYIGVYTDFTEKDSDKASDYTWSKWQGKDGDQGVPGSNGYIHFAYSTSSDGSKNFSTSEFDGATYLGVYSDNSQADSQDYKKYAWSLFKGADATITSTLVEYIATTEKSSNPPQSIEIVDANGNNIISNNGDILLTNKWSTEIPDLDDGSYLWTRTTVVYSDGNSTVTYSNAKQGDSGVPGRTYFVELDASAVKIDGNNIITPDTITAKAFYRDGDGDRVAYPCRFVITKTYGNNFIEEILRSSSNTVQQSFTIYGEAEMPAYYTVEIHKAGQTPTNDNLLDIQTVPILVDSENLMIGARNLLKFSNSVNGAFSYGVANAYQITEEEIDETVVTRIANGIGTNTAKAVYYEIYTDNIMNLEVGTKLTVSMRVYARQAMQLNVCLANANGVMQTTDSKSISLWPGWNTVYTVLTLVDKEFELVTDTRDNFGTSNNLVLSTGDVGLISNVLRITDNMGSNDYYALSYIQLEKGNRPTDFYPAPEDIASYTDDAIDNMSDELRGIISDVLNQVTANRDELDSLTSESGRIEEIRRSSVITQQQVDRVETNVETYIIQVDAVAGRVVDIEKTTECFSMEDAGLRITRKISGQQESDRLSMLLSEQKLSFYQGSQEVAYFSNNKLYVTDAEILNKIQIGNYAFIPRSNGNLSFRYIANS